MKESLLKKFQQLESSKTALLESLNELSDKQVNQPTENGKWSIAQILFHVWLGERYSLQYMQKKIHDVDSLGKSGFKESFKSAMLKVALRLPVKYKAPKSISHDILAEIEWEKFLANWSKTREELYQFLEQMPEKAIPLNIFRHPRIGLININQTLQFYQEHFDHHLPQVKGHLSKFKAAA